MPDAAPLVLRYRDLSAQVRARVLEYVARVWGRLPDYRDADIDLFVRAVVPVVQGGQRQIASLTDAYLAQFDRIVTGSTARPVGIPAEVYQDVRGVPASDVYQRAGRTVWTALSKGTDFPDAVKQGLDRALNMAASDIQLAKTHTSRYAMGKNRDVVGYRRVLEGSESCGLCIVASTQRYRKGDLMPIHGGCDCSVQPIYGRNDPGLIIEPERLESVHDRIQERFGVSDRGARRPIDYRSALITHQHGELGPVLSVRGQKFTGPNDL